MYQLTTRYEIFLSQVVNFQTTLTGIKGLFFPPLGFHSGVHHIALVNCTCRDRDNLVKDLIFSWMVPTSFVRIRTLFTTDVLDHFRLSNLEMTTSAYQYFQMLRRATMPMSPHKVINFYHELRRLSRLWRWVKKLKWAGYGQQTSNPIEPGPGELAKFCLACPQPRINLSADWLEDPNRWVFRRFLVADGNFKADHVRQKTSADDIWLSNGTGMMTEHEAYHRFLENAQERNSVCTNLQMLTL